MNDERIEQEAASWVLRHDRGLAASEQDEYLQWLAADRRHGAALARHRENWSRLDVLAQWRPEHGPRPNRDLLAPSHAGLRRVARFAGAAALLAAAVAIAFLGFFRPWKAAPAPAASAPAPIATIEQRRMDDGSLIEMNRGAEIAVLYTPVERRVRLERGEANFTVAKNPGRPFIVEAGGVAVRAVGTVFNVRLDAREVKVLVTEGRVQVQPPAETAAIPELAAGEHATVSLVAPATPVVRVVEDTERDAMLAWQPRTLDFTAAPLRGVVAEFNRRNAPVHLVIADPALAEIEVSASLQSDNVEGFIRLLEAGFGVKAERSGSRVVLKR